MAPPNITCPGGYYYWYGDCLLVDNTERHWFEASANCYSNGGYLASIHSLAENRWMYELLRLYDYAGRDVWIGLNDISLDNNMEWVDGTAYEYNSFLAGRPNNAADNCVVFVANNNGAWYDLPCPWARRSICKYNTTQAVPSPGK